MNPTKPFPRVHPIVSLLGAEWERVGSAQTEEERVLDFSNFSIARSIEMCNEAMARQPDLKSKLMMKNLPTLLRFKKYTAWWTPGIPDSNDEVDQLAGTHIIQISIYGISLILADDDELTSEQPLSTQESVLKDGEGMPMDEDEVDDQTPRRSRTRKRAIVTSPSEMEVHPARRPRISIMKVRIS